ncbi:uncharacterized protein B0H18DRAFT_1121442 [Fomitopsis serialis]|uniref:uncharacterized protein n=1 Tax=Fomitopsis serialis TaxID=139415 RepID=UPI0020075636|nr:uncharacterized protein B0H18DRAFT_1121442 [Neoantrodia serialis]KAH9921291.1 hypothetical protein B0H18DRAFT_1121442 [Neoantrodia serialis]
MELDEFTVVLDELTKNVYVLIAAHDPTIDCGTEDEHLACSEEVRGARGEIMVKDHDEELPLGTAVQTSGLACTPGEFWSA